MRRLVFNFLQFSLLILLFIEQDSFAQEKAPDDFYLTISSVEKREGSLIEARIGFGSDIGIQKGQNCSVWGLDYKDYPEHNQYTLATGQVIEVSDTSSLVLLTELDTSAVKRVYEGDMVHIQLGGKTGFQGPFYNMIRNDIFFHDQNNEPFYILADIFFEDSENTEKTLLEENGRGCTKPWRKPFGRYGGQGYKQGEYLTGKPCL